MSDEGEAHSTHQMVVGLHRRFDTVEKSVESLKEESKQASERMIRMEGRIDLAEAKADATAEREMLIHDNVKDALANTNALVKKLFDKFDAHTEEEAKDRKELSEERQSNLKEQKKTLVWVISTAIPVLLTVFMYLLGKVFP